MRASSDGSGSSSSSPQQAKRRVGLTQYAEMQLKQRLRKDAPSEPWVEAQIKAAEDTDADGRPIIYRYHDPHVFPPGGEETLMVRCPKCGVLTPPNGIEHGACLDHAPHDGWGPSPSAIAILRYENLNQRNDQIEILPEDTRSLRKEIQAFLRSGRTSV